MFSKEFMRYLLNYEPDGYETKKVETVKEIEFKNNNGGRLAKVFLSVNTK